MSCAHSRLSGGIAIACVAAAGCALPAVPIHPPDGTVLQMTRDAVQYRGSLIRDLKAPSRPLSAYGEACNDSFYLPTSPSSPFPGTNLLANINPLPTLGLGFGDAGLIRAVRSARDSVGGREIFDVRLDVHSTSILGIWHHDCVEVHAAALP